MHEDINKVTNYWAKKVFLVFFNEAYLGKGAKLLSPINPLTCDVLWKNHAVHSPKINMMYWIIVRSKVPSVDLSN